MAVQKEQDQGVFKRQQSQGEQAYNKALYWGIGFGLNTVLSIYLTHKLKDQNPEIFKQWGQNFAKWTRNFGMKGGKATASFGENATENITLLSGGFAVLPLVKWGENGAKPYVQKLDSLFGTKQPQVELEDGTRIDSIDLKPKQTWLSMIGARFASIGIGYVPLFALFTPFPNYFKPVEKAGMAGRKLIPKVLYDWMPKTEAFRVTVSKEVISSAITTASLFVFGRAIAWWDEQRKKGKGDVPQMAGVMQPSSAKVKLPEEVATIKVMEDAEPSFDVETKPEKRIQADPEAKTERIAEEPQLSPSAA